MNKNTLLFERYETQALVWPRSGRHILAQFDDDTIVVYQAYRPEIGHFAAQNGRFGGAFSFARMTWIKPNFLWMMYRSGWGQKPDQEVTLALRLTRAGFEWLLAEAVPSSYAPDAYATEADWQAAVRRSSVRLQWDPDHSPSGAPLERRAIQLGIRDAALTRMTDEFIVSITDVSDFVASQRGAPLDALELPRERVYPLPAPLVAHLGAGG